ncbi:MAG: hypothetical protein FJX44_09415 [Alphaproteobacteria bacterium]|nr:hypothetical protein [Alphaproteobacteria bacterium]
MGGFKLTTWNMEWLVDAFRVATGAVPPGSRKGNRRMPSAAQAQAKLDGVVQEIRLIDPDILLLTEAIPDPDEMGEFVNTYLKAYRLIDRAGEARDAYDIKGDQWMWFLTKPEIKEKRKAHLLDNTTWRAYTKKIYTSQTARRQHRDGYWWISLPQIDKTSGQVGANQLKPHSHHRHPQVLVADWDGSRIEFIGVHLKSKFIGERVPARKSAEKDKDYYARDDVRRYMAKAVQARAKLTTEATDVRHYIEQRFAQEPLPSIFLLGDLNDGPGKELLEREYMLHDLIGNLQGDVFFARQFLSHALFDSSDRFRWTVEFRDELDPSRRPFILLDHIVFTEALTRRGKSPLIVHPGMGKVEHEIHDRVASMLPPKTCISDHRPVSVVVSERSERI